MRKFTLLMLLLLINICVSAQVPSIKDSLTFDLNDPIDSVFLAAFEAIELELQGGYRLYLLSDYDRHLDLFVDDSGDSVLMNIGLNPSIEFLESITNIKAPWTGVSNNRHFRKPNINGTTANDWVSWYLKYREKLVWDQNLGKPKLSSYP